MRRSLWLTAAALSLGFTMHAQERKPMTLVHLYKVKPGADSAWNSNIRKYFVPVMQKLMAEGAVLAYGADEDLLHFEKAPNYAVWTTVPNYAAYAKVLKATDSMFDSMPAADREQMLRLHDADAHSDFIVVPVISRHGAVKPGTLPFSRMSMHKVRPGKMQDYRKAYEQYTKPVLDALLDKGTILGYSLETVAMHTSEPGMVYQFISVASLDALDAVSAALEEANDRLTEAQRSLRNGILREATDAAAHRDGLMRSIVFAAK